MRLETAGFGTKRWQSLKRSDVLVAVCEQKDKEDVGFALAAMRLPLEAL